MFVILMSNIKTVNPILKYGIFFNETYVYLLKMNRILTLEF